MPDAIYLSTLIMTKTVKQMISSCPQSALMRHAAWRSGHPAAGNVEVHF